ncbi:zinc metalloprotease [Mycobacteroides abscessus]|uniref:hypothetical protein n=1 Tax=Mycobacteroides abscessus TaxID=36809 RepID=UPI000929F72C|nr:hypothetical protein [Mycobacteroides abscessus]SHP48023.1 Uncharacterised protein [Mycobacteroides abscessus subsp. abscessus]SHP49850.1 Uncharacterised protein [Mycobacteroides abscessus subsp. abscessus]SHP68624.1 Uncharacterised protein [Mycobacteroides abscessus subsp. abscessus]SHQ24810.1 Uncharacterised protein [Mycobacteroides abscessus subsp. abscessus]SHR11917.1 Uncharacterised protein [Mycobacteroides abscessus subsp. abscessus]
MTFVLPDPLPKGAAELDALRTRACRELEVFKARQAASHEFSAQDVRRAEYLLSSRDKIDAVNAARMAHHEAGHAVLAVLVGGQVASAEVFPAGQTDDEGKDGYCQYIPPNLAVKQHEHLIAAAGAAAEAIWEHGPRATAQQADHRLIGSDATFLRHCALTAGAVRTVSPITEVLPLVARCWPAIESLAARLSRHEQVSHKHVVKALGLSHDYTQHPFELNNIRSGLRAVPDQRDAK